MFSNFSVETGLLENIVRSLPAGVLMCDERLRITDATPLALAYLRRSPATITGLALQVALQLPERDHGHLQRQLESRALPHDSLQPPTEFEAHQHVFRYRLFPVTLSGGVRLRTGVVLWDVTKERRLKDQLMQADKHRTTLMAGMAHEMNNPSQAILGTAELILQERNPDTILAYAQDIVNYSKHLGHVIRHFSTTDRSPTTHHETDVDLRERLAEAVTIVRRRPSFGAIRVVTMFEPVPTVLADQTEIDQALVNLTSNAAQAMNGNGLLTVGCRMDGDRIVVQVGDSGLGIPGSVLPHIFEPFFTTKEAGKGTGLGLSIVRDIVARYGATIEVESEQNRGTTFTVRFPVQRGRRRKEQCG